jgi:2,5-furandicarboxylate decarboxylase 1
MAEANLFRKIKEVVPGRAKVYLPLSAGARLHAYAQIRKTNDGEPKTVIAMALSADYRIKHVIVVDEDVNIYDDEDVLWAVSTRSQWEKDLGVIPGIMGSSLDPSANGLITTKGGIDATKPIGQNTFAPKISIPESVKNSIRLEDYLDEDARSR